MKLIERILKNDKKCKRFLGLKSSQINELANKIAPYWKEQEISRLTRPDRKRAIGAGRKYEFKTTSDMLVVNLMYYKIYLTQEFVAAILNVDQSTVSRIISKFLLLIEKAANPELEALLQTTESLKNHRIKNFAELQKIYPEFADLITDATETPCNRPANKNDQKKFYSGKQKTHTLKTQITINSNKRIVALSDTYPGSVHDKSIFDFDQTINKIHPCAKHTLDKGYTGIEREYPNHNISIPRKRKNRQEMPPFLKKINTFIAKKRIAVEHVISRIKNFRICSYTYRGNRNKFNQIFRNIVAIYNFSIATI